MTLSTLTSRVSYPGAGSPGPFAIPFRFLSAADLLVTKRSAAGTETTLALTTHYTVTGANEATGTLTLVTALAAGETLAIRRKPAITQPTSIRNQGSYYPATIEDEFDRLAMQIQGLKDELDRTPKLKETYDPASYSMSGLVPSANQVLAFNSAGTGIEARSISEGATVLPGAGRTVATLSAYLANNAVFNVKDFGATGGGVADDGAALVATVAAANLVVITEPGVRDAVGAIVYFPAGKYYSTLGLNPYPGVTFVGEGLWSSTIIFARTSAQDGIVWDRVAAGFPAIFSGFGWGGGIRDMKVTTDNYKIAGFTAKDLVVVKGLVHFDLTRVLLQKTSGRLLHLENVIAITMNQVGIHQNDGDCGFFIGSPAGVSTTVRAFQVYQSACANGPGMDVAGLSLDFFGLILESNGSGAANGTGAGGYGGRIRYGKVGLYSPYFEDNYDHDLWIGSDANANLTSVVVTNPTLMVSGTKLAGKGGFLLDRCKQVSVVSGDLSASSRPIEITDNCGQVDISAYLGANVVPILTGGLNWRSKADLNYRKNNDGRAQTVSKAAVARLGTAVLGIPVTESTNQSAFLRVYAAITDDASPGLMTGVEITIFKEWGGVDGGAVIRLLGDDSGTGHANFVVVAGDFITTFSDANTARVTYTNNNISGSNKASFWVEGVGIAGDLTIA